jgi:hypothetical protein
LASKALNSQPAKLSDEGKVLVADVRDAVEKLKLLFLSKNDGNLLQDFIWQCQQITAGDATLPNAPTDKATAQEHGNQALAGLRTLGTLILSNGQFRKLLSDATVLVRDMAGDAATHAASRINPSEDKLSQIDHPAQDDTWHDVPSITELKGQARDMYNKNKPFSRDEVKGELNQQAQTSDRPQEGARAAVDNLQARAQQNVPDETQENLNKSGQAARDQTRAYLSKKMPKERREQTVWRLKKMIVEIQRHPDCKKLSKNESYGF